MFGGLRLALSWLTVLPVPHGHDGPPIDRAAGRRAIAAAPVVGLFLGLLAAGVTALLLTASLGSALAGLAAVAALALATRGMHVDGLADTVDGLGCYGPPDRALAVMRSGGVGPFGVAALLLCLAAQSFSFGDLAASGHWVAVVVAVAAGRVSAVLTCRPALPAAAPTGFGALVAGTQPRWMCAAWATTAVCTAVVAVPDRWWQGPLVVAVVLAMSVALGGHCARRFGGITGDVLGAVIELTTTLTAVGFLLGG